MAQKAAKTTAKRNAQTLNRTHSITLAVHAFYLLLRGLAFKTSFHRSSFLIYVLLSVPALVIELFFERGSRPKYISGVVGGGGEIKQSGDDLEAKGLTEWMWDVLYWSWACIVLAAVFGDWAWWAYVAVPLYSSWLAYTTFGGVRKSMAGLSGAAQETPIVTGGSKRQQKMEKRGAQKVQYR